jgi:pimeloyl-ACP methyl ester carboxylesterase
MRFSGAAHAALCAIIFLTTRVDAFVATPVTFDVTIQNRSIVPCLGAGSGPAEIAGTLITPDSLPPNPSVTLYLHGLGFGQWFWHFATPTITDLDYAVELAELGHSSVIIDRLGYGASSHPDGNQSCIGVQADIAHQIIGQLRAQFSKVALAGHSAGGAVAEVEAYSFHDADALIIASYADQGASPDALVAFMQGGGECLGSSDHYGHFGQMDADFDHLMFNTPRATPPIALPLDSSEPTADANVISAATTMREQDPCGDYNSISFEIVLSQLLLTQIQAPVLLVCGDEDAIFPPPACDLQALHFASNADFTHSTISGGGHALTLGFAAQDFRGVVAGWLAARGF